MSEWDYELAVCGDNQTGAEHYLFTLNEEDTCLIVKTRGYWTHVYNICLSYLYYLWI